MEQVRNIVKWLRGVAPERLLLIALLAATIGLWWWAVTSLPRPLEVVALAVGDGDAFLIRAPSGRTVLLDGGSRSQQAVGERVLVPNLLLLGVRKLDAVIITHPDSDHFNGLPAVMQAVPVGMILTPGLPSEEAEYQQVLEWAKQDEIPHFVVRAGDRLNLDRGVRLEILAPAHFLLAGTAADDNNNSLVCMLTYRRARMLFTGDLQLEGELALLSRDLDLRAGVLKVAHHGSRTGTGDAFLHAVQPFRAVISAAGTGTHRHPHDEVLQRLRDRGVQILRTDVHGRIRLTTDGYAWKVSTYRKALAETR